MDDWFAECMASYVAISFPHLYHPLVWPVIRSGGFSLKNSYTVQSLHNLINKAVSYQLEEQGSIPSKTDLFSDNLMKLLQLNMFLFIYRIYQIKGQLVQITYSRHYVLQCSPLSTHILRLYNDHSSLCSFMDI